MVPKVKNRTVGPWWVGGRGWVYEEAYVLEDGRVVSRQQFLSDPVSLCQRSNQDMYGSSDLCRRAARALHVELSRLGIKDHYGFASRVLGRKVRHLRELTPHERNRIREAAYELIAKSESNHEPVTC